MAVTIQDDMFVAAEHMEEPQRSRFLAALVTYGITNKEPDEREPWYWMFFLVRERLQMSAQKMNAGKELANRRWEIERQKKEQLLDADDTAHSHTHE